MQLKKPSDTEREGESARSKVQIHPQFHLSDANPYTHRSEQRVSNQQTYKERKSKRKRKKERRETFNRTILRWIAVSNFFFFLLFLCITIWLDCLSLAWDGDGRPYESSLDSKFFPSSVPQYRWAFSFRERKCPAESDDKRWLGFF